MSAPAVAPPRDPLEQLPGDLMIRAPIVSELLAFGAGPAAFLSVRIGDPQGFAAAQDQLHRAAGGVNTIVLVTSGLLAALALRARLAGRRGAARLMLGIAAALGVVFLAVKRVEFSDLASAGISTDTHPFFTFHFLLAGFHAAQVAAGVVVLVLVAWRDAPENIENGAGFWHMVDLVWVLLFPVIYLLP